MTITLTVLGSVPPPCDHTAVAVCDRVGGGGKAHGLDQRAEGGGPGLFQMQQSDVIVKGIGIVVFMHHDPLDLCHVFGTALRQHAEVGPPVTRVREPAESEGRGQGLCRSAGAHPINYHG